MKRTNAVVLAILAIMAAFAVSNPNPAYAGGPLACTQEEVEAPNSIFMVLSFDAENPEATFFVGSEEVYETVNFRDVIRGAMLVKGERLERYPFYTAQPMFEVPETYDLTWDHVVWARGTSNVSALRNEGNKTYRSNTCHVANPSHIGLTHHLNGMVRTNGFWGLVYKINP
ncbi:hypothetical protein HN358_00770 [Candidatus Uhrbacteria bacterium]|jgi:hypothetical protein|nr:hypothetical protein [Candidatus Uhrbacteria bacterium]MBT7717418.1 hypothetical protein [Candidatus Uhrbacteria bacterium]